MMIGKLYVEWMCTADPRLMFVKRLLLTPLHKKIHDLKFLVCFEKASTHVNKYINPKLFLKPIKAYAKNPEKF